MWSMLRCYNDSWSNKSSCEQYEPAGNGMSTKGYEGQESPMIEVTAKEWLVKRQHARKSV
jgi:hypothetical protein